MKNLNEGVYLGTDLEGQPPVLLEQFNKKNKTKNYIIQGKPGVGRGFNVKTSNNLCSPPMHK